MGGAEAARAFYERAASEPIAYYGQLAAQRLGQTRLALRAPKAAAEGDKRDEAVGAAAALYADGLDDLATSLAFDAARQWRDESQIAAMAEVVKRFGDAGTQVQFGKFALIRGYPFDAMAFPSSGMPAFLPLARSADLPTVYAVARQESEFIWRSASGAGAKGLMQMLPSTAASDCPAGRRRVRLRPPHRRSRLQHQARRCAPGPTDCRRGRVARTRFRRL